MNALDKQIITNRFPTGELESQHTEVGGVACGVKRRWHLNGQLFSEAEFQDGLVDGVIRQWSSEGQLILCARAKAGELDGYYESWWDNGLPKEQGSYSAGVRQSGYKWFREDGALWRELP